MSTKKLNPKILIVEDNVSTYNNLKNFFLEAGFEIAMFKNGIAAVDSFERAIEVLKTEGADIALLDIEINGDKDGLELGQYISTQYNIPVIFLTGQDTLENRLIADQFAKVPIIEKISKSLPNEMLLKSINFLWTKLLLQTPAPQKLEIRAVEMIVDAENFDKALPTVDQHAIKTLLYCHEIAFISSFYKHNLLHLLSSNKAYRTRNSIDQLVVLLGQYFMRISKSIAVNLNAVTRIDEVKRTCMIKQYEIKIGKDYWNDFALRMKGKV